MMRTIQLTREDPDASVEALKGKLLGADSFERLITEDANVFKPDGSLLLRFRRRVLPDEECRTAFAALRTAAKTTRNRGFAAGDFEAGEEVGSRTSVRFMLRKRDGTLSGTNLAKSVESGIVGYFDRTPRYPFCRQTAWTTKEYPKYLAALPFLGSVSENFARFEPNRYNAQRAYVERVNPDFRIEGTVFTTITVNLNWQTAVHQDAGDLRAGFGVMTCLRAGTFDGCYFCFPKFKIAVDMRMGDLLLADVHEWHGNTPFKGRAGFERVSLVCYVREKMIACGSSREEEAIAKRRARGTPLNEGKKR